MTFVEKVQEALKTVDPLTWGSERPLTEAEKITRAILIARYNWDHPEEVV